jgi:AbrB family looped-hinge helix DNA binding protein
MKTETIQIDKAGRLVLPKPVREQFHLEPGDRLKIFIEGHSIRLEPADAGGTLIRKGGVLVFTGEFNQPVTATVVQELISEGREERYTVPAKRPKK